MKDLKEEPQCCNEVMTERQPDDCCKTCDPESERIETLTNLPTRPDNALYIGCKIIRAEPMTNKQFSIEKFNGSATVDEIMEGYKVIYEDGYVSWSPKSTFERAYRKISPGEMKLIF